MDIMSNPPTIDYGRPGPKRKTSPLVWIVLFLFVGVLLAWMLLPSINRDRESASQIKCASNLRSVGQAVDLYSRENAGVFPPDLQTVLATQQISAESFTCPRSSDTGAKAPSGLAQPGHCSYIYVGASLSAKSDPDCIVALEDPANHDLEGGQILFADGHVSWEDLPTVMQALNDLAIGKNPPSAATFTTASAKQDYRKNWQSRMPQLKFGVWMIPTTQPAAAKPSL